VDRVGEGGRGGGGGGIESESVEERIKRRTQERIAELHEKNRLEAEVCVCVCVCV